MDPENITGQVDVDLDNTLVHLTKDEYINEGYSHGKVKEYFIDTALYIVKAKHIIEYYSDVKIEEHSFNELDSSKKW